MSEHHYKQQRRQWPEERRLRDIARREKLRTKFIHYVPNPLAPADTLGMVWEEKEVIQYLRGRGWVKLWKALGELSNSRSDPVWKSRPKRQGLLALVTRMLREQKLLRHRKSNTITLAPWLA